MKGLSLFANATPRRTAQLYTGCGETGGSQHRNHQGRSQGVGKTGRRDCGADITGSSELLRACGRTTHNPAGSAPSKRGSACLFGRQG